MSNPEIVPDTFRKAYWKNLKNFGLLVVGNLAVGTGINIAITRLYPKFLILPTLARLPLRLFILAAPSVICSSKLIELYDRSNDMVEEQFIKIQRFRKSGNIEEYFK